MEGKKELILRLAISLTGVAIMIGAFYLLFLKINPLISQILSKSFSFQTIAGVNIRIYIYLIILGYIIFFIGRYWRNALKEISKIMVSIAIFFLFFAITFYAANSNAQNITNSIQPSFDMLIANFIPTPIDSMIQKNSGKNINLIISQNSKLKTFYAKNLSLNDSAILSKSLNTTNLASADQLTLNKFIISTTYENLLKTAPNSVDSPIPISLISQYEKNSGVDFSTLTHQQIQMLKNVAINPNAQINVLFSKNNTVKKITVGKINSTDASTLWKTLGLNYTVSSNTKETVLNLAFSTLLSQHNLNFANIPLPLSAFKSMIPTSIKKISGFDLFSKNLTTRTMALENLRNYCNDNSKNSSKILNQTCSYVDFSNYSYFMTNIGNITKSNKINLSNSTIATLSQYDSLKKIDSKLRQKTSSYFNFIFIFIIFMGLAIGSYYLYFKINKETPPKYHISYFIAKINLFAVIPLVLVIYGMYYIINSNFLIQLIKENVSSQIASSINLVASLPIYKEILNVNSFANILSLTYLILSVVIFGIFFFLLKKEIKDMDENQL